MIKEKAGDILSESGIIVNRISYLGKMDQGTAKQIKENILSPEDFTLYRQTCQKFRTSLTSRVQYLPSGNGKVIANCFSEVIAKEDTITDLAALEESLSNVALMSEKHKLRVIFPGPADENESGNWRAVRKIIYKVFGASSKINTSIVYKNGIDFLKYSKEAV